MIIPILLLSALVFFVWILIEPRLYRVTGFEIQCSKLTKPLQILHLSDIHFAYPDKQLFRFFDRLAKLNPDLIVITGDVIDCREGVAVAEKQFARLNSKHGIFAVMGNHDYYDYRLLDSVLLHNLQGLRHPRQRNGTLHLREVYERLKIKELRNQSLHLEINGQRVGMHGVDDPVTGHADLTQIRPEKSSGVVNLLLSHTIDVLLGLSDHEIDVCFSGHTHGGQVCIPGWGAVITQTRMGRHFAAGIHKFMNISCCISRGMGSSRFMRIRFFSMPEAILLTLKP